MYTCLGTCVLSLHVAGSHRKAHHASRCKMRVLLPYGAHASVDTAVQSNTRYAVQHGVRWQLLMARSVAPTLVLSFPLFPHSRRQRPPCSASACCRTAPSAATSTAAFSLRKAAASPERPPAAALRLVAFPGCVADDNRCCSASRTFTSTCSAGGRMLCQVSGIGTCSGAVTLAASACERVPGTKHVFVRGSGGL